MRASLVVEAVCWAAAALAMPTCLWLATTRTETRVGEAIFEAFEQQIVTMNIPGFEGMLAKRRIGYPGESVT